MSTPKKIILGAPGAVEQPIQYSASPSRGFVVTRKWRGPEKSIRALFAGLTAGGWEWNCIGGPVWEVTATYGGVIDGSAEVPISLWELQPNALEKDLLRADNATLNSIAQDQKDLLQASIDAGDKTVPTTITDNTAKALWKYMHLGEKSVYVFAPVLRHTVTVSNQYKVAFSLTNVGRVITSATLITTEAVPNTLLVALPADVYGNAAYPDLFYGWLKLYPTVSQVAYNKFSIVQEYQYGLWNTLVYGAAL